MNNEGPRVTPKPSRRTSKVIWVNWWKGSSLGATDKYRSWQAWGLGIAATAAVFVSVSGLVAYEVSRRPADTIIQTGANETRTQKFGDGIEVLVKELSKLHIAAAEECCLTRLFAGYAQFTVPENPARQLTVTTDFAAASTTGGKFSVALRAGILVEVEEGSVRVTRPGGAAVTLKKGERYRLGDGLRAAGPAVVVSHGA